MSKFLTFDEIRTHTLNGNVVESRRKLAVNIDHVTRIPLNFQKLAVRRSPFGSSGPWNHSERFRRHYL